MASLRRCFQHSGRFFNSDVPGIVLCYLVLMLPYQPVVLAIGEPGPPTISTAPKDVKVAAKGKAVFICKAQGNPIPTIYWERDNKRISPRRYRHVITDSPYLSVLSIEPARFGRDNGEIACVADNSIGTVRVTAQLTVYKNINDLQGSYPQIVHRPVDTIVLKGFKAQMDCKATGNPEPNILWIKNRLPVNMEDPRINQSSSGSLNIQNTTEYDQGLYECLAENGVGMVSMYAYLVTRKGQRLDLEPPVVPIMPQFHHVAADDTVSFFCAPPGNYPSTFRWETADLTEISPRWNRYLIKDTPFMSVLRIDPVKPKKDGRRFMCVVREGETTLRRDFKLTIYNDDSEVPKGYPKITASPSQTIVNESDTVELQCQSAGIPQPRIIWLKDYIPVNMSDPRITIINTGHLQIKNVVDLDTGMYECVSENEVGVAYSKGVMVYIKEQPRQTGNRVAEDIDVAPGSSPRNIQARAASSTTIVVNWNEPEIPNGIIQGYKVFYTLQPENPIFFWDVQDVTNNNKLTTISGLEPNQTYTISVLAFSANGQGPMSNPIQVVTAPGGILFTEQGAGYTVPYQPLNLHANPISANEIEVMWDAPQESDSILSYEVYYNDSHFRQNIRISIKPPVEKYKLTDLTPDTVYHIQVSAKSQRGEGPKTPTIQAKTKPFIPGPPRKVRVEIINSTAVFVEWRTPNTSGQNGIIRGYQVYYYEVDSNNELIPGKQARFSDTFDGTKLESVITGLDPDTRYNVRVAAYTRKGDGIRSKPKVITTWGPVPSPPRNLHLELVQEDPPIVRVTWQRPQETHGPIANYMIIYGRIGEGYKEWILPSERYSFVTHSLDKGTTYKFCVSAKNGVGYGERSVENIRTPDGAPAGAPLNFTATGLSKTSVHLTWDLPARALRNGDIAMYQITYHKLSDPINEEDLNVTDTYVDISGLEMNTDYRFNVRAYTSKGSGPWSNNLHFRTFDHEPPVPSNVKIRHTSSSTIEVKWDKPNFPVAGYKIYYNMFATPNMDVWQTLETGPYTVAEITGLESNTVYAVRVQAHSVDGRYGNLSEIVTTDVIPSLQKDVVQNFRVTLRTSNMVKLSWDKPQKPGVSSYILKYEGVKNYLENGVMKQIYQAKEVQIPGQMTTWSFPNLQPKMKFVFNISVIFQDSTAGQDQHIIVETLIEGSEPQITQAPKDYKVAENMKVIFFCEASGANVTIHWKKLDGRKILKPRGRYFTTDKGNQSVLVIKPVKSRDSSTFTCVVTNGLGESRANATLEVYSSDSFGDGNLPVGYPTITLHPRLKAVEKGRTALLLCEAIGMPKPSITWIKDDMPLSLDNPRISLVGKGALQIDDSQESDAGKYECVAENEVGVAISHAARLYVKVRRAPPHFSVHPKDIRVMPGSDVSLTCVAVGSPMPFVQWRSGDKNLTGEYDVPIGQNILKLTDMRESKIYTCIASSVLGSVETSAQVIVEAPGSAPQNVRAQAVSSTTIVVSWEEPKIPNGVIQGYKVFYTRQHEKPIFFWDVQDVTNNNKLTTISGLEPNQTYTISALAYSGIGQGPMSNPMQVLTTPGAGHIVPSPPLNLHADPISANEIEIMWDAPQESDSILSYQLYYNDSHFHQFVRISIIPPVETYTLTDLKPGTVYQIQVSAQSQSGEGPKTPMILVKTKPLLPGEPSRVRLETINSTAISVKWQPPSKSERNGIIRGYQVHYYEVDSNDETIPGKPPQIFYSFNGTKYESVITGLDPDTRYSVMVAAFTRMGDGIRSKPRVITTKRAVLPAPMNVQVSRTSSSTIEVTWDEPDFPVAGYKIYYNMFATPNMDAWQTLGIGPYTVAEITGLHPHTVYAVRVQARSVDGQYGNLSVIVIGDTSPPVTDGKPQITQAPKDYKVAENMKVIFFCEASGANVTIHWEKGGRKILKRRGRYFTTDKGNQSVLVIEPVKSRDSSTFTCVIANGLGESRANATLKVYSSDSFGDGKLPVGYPTITLHPYLKAVEKGRTALLSCEAIGMPKPSITWIKDDMPLSLDNARISVLDKGYLQIKESKESDEGSYSCVAQNEVGVAYSYRSMLYVKVRLVPPRFIVQPDDIQVMQGANINLTCVATGSPMPYVGWLEGDHGITNEDDIPMGKNVLQLTDIRKSKNYTCIASSRIGEIETTIHVTVLEKDTPPLHSHSISANEIEVTWDVSEDSDSVVRYVLYHNDTYLQKNTSIEIQPTGNSYKLIDLTPDTLYSMMLSRTYQNGKEVNTSVTEAKTNPYIPGQPRGVQIEKKNPTSIQVKWQPPSDSEPAGIIRGYEVFVYEVDGSGKPVQSSQPVLFDTYNGMKYEAVITGCNPAKSYSVRVGAYTRRGGGVRSAPVFTAVGDEAWTSYKINVTARSAVGNGQEVIIPVETKSAETSCNMEITSDTHKTGTINSPSFPHPYPAGVTCTYTFTGSKLERVQLNFTHMSLHDVNPISCEGFDSVMVKTPIDGELKELGTYCGTKIPPMLMSAGNNMTVVFHSETLSEGQAMGFNATYSFVTNYGVKSGEQNQSGECIFKYNSQVATQGNFTSPNWPGLYPHNTECQYLFLGEGTETVHIQFHDFDVDGIGPRCSEETNSDYVSFSNFANVEDRRFSRYCGGGDEGRTLKVQSDGSFFRVTFKSNDIYDNRGFYAEYTFQNKAWTSYKINVTARSAVGNGQEVIIPMETKSAETSCNMEITSDTHKTGTINSPSFPNPYPAGVTCTYTFTGSNLERVRLSFTHMSLHSVDPISCEGFDSVMVKTPVDGELKELGTYCGTKLPPMLMSAGNNMTVVFHSETSSEGHAMGFNATYSFVTNYGIKSGEQNQSGECIFKYNSQVATQGNFTSPNWPGLYPHNTECQYLFLGEGTETVQIQFHDFDVEGIGPRCSEDTNSDYVSFSNFANVEDRRLSRYCGGGDEGRTKVQSDGSFFRVTFKSNDIYDDRGFYAEYKFQKTSCNMEITSDTHKTGTINSPSFPHPYPAGVTCTYTFTGSNLERVRLNFTHMSLHDVNPISCEGFDSVMVKTPVDGELKELGTYCGTKLPPMLMSAGNNMTVVFHSETLSEGQAMGFNASYSFVANYGIKSGEQNQSGECIFKYSSHVATQGNFTSPNWPGLYPRNTECQYLFFGEGTETVQIQFHDFDVDGIGPRCSEDTNSDYVSFSNFANVEDRRLSRYCGGGDEGRTKVQSDGSFFRVTFKSNDIYDDRGFYAEYKFQNKPSACKVTVIKVTPNTVRLLITPPIDDGGSPVLDYKISYYQEGRPNEVSVGRTFSGEYEIDELLPRTQYKIGIAARNAIGYGPTVTVSVATRSIGPPGPCNVTAAEVTHDSIRLMITPPADTGGIPLNDYTIYYSEEERPHEIFTRKAGISSDPDAPLKEVLINELKPRTSYQISVTAGNAIAYGEHVTISVQTKSLSPPSHPLVQMAEVTPTSVSLAISTPSYKQREPAREYVVVYGLKGRSFKQSKIIEANTNPEKSTLVTLTDLKPSSTYMIDVQTRSAIGRGGESRIFVQTPLI